MRPCEAACIRCDHVNAAGLKIAPERKQVILDTKSLQASRPAHLTCIFQERPGRDVLLLIVSLPILCIDTTDNCYIYSKMPCTVQGFELPSELHGINTFLQAMEQRQSWKNTYYTEK